MKFSLYSAIIFAPICSLTSNAQNLVPNPGFESYSELPDLWGQWDRVDDWNNAGGEPEGGYYADPDYFHTEGSGTVQLPNPSPAMVEAHSGDAIMGFLGYQNPEGDNIREYIMVELETALVIGETYAVSFWITNGFSTIGHYLQCDRIGINFSTEALDQEGNSFIDRTPQLEIDGELFVTEWQEFSFSFLADLAYTHLTIGNFYSDDETSVSVAIEEPRPFAGAYYFVDDFSVEIEENSNIGLQENTKNVIFSVFPNPIKNQVQIKLNTETKGPITFTIYALDGQILDTGQLSESMLIDLSSLSAGNYILDVKINGVHSNQRIVKE